MAAVYTETLSWYTTYLLFDSPLCAGQEFSTRAVRHKDWPMAPEAGAWVGGGLVDGELVEKCLECGGRGKRSNPGESYETHGVTAGMAFTCKSCGGEGERTVRRKVKTDPQWQPHRVLKGLHDDWFEVFEAEVEWWKNEFQKPCEHCDGEGAKAEGAGLSRVCEPCKGTGKKYPTHDKEPFRPALDRARWAIPGTIATGCAHTGHLRERARVLQNGLAIAQMSNDPASVRVWENIAEGYKAALPGLSGLGLREAVYTSDTKLPGHLRMGIAFFDVDVRVGLQVNPFAKLDKGVSPFRREPGERTYVDPFWNSYAQVQLQLQCSLAVSRDWHRHRTMYPWVLRVVRDAQSSNGVTHSLSSIMLDHHYEPKSKIGNAKTPELLQRSTRAYDEFMMNGNQMKAMLSLPLGTRVQMTGTAGLRDAIYCLELRKHAVGANFEYQEQAATAILQLRGCLTAGTPEAVQDEYLGV